MRGKLLVYIFLVLGIFEIVLVTQDYKSYLYFHPLGVLLIYLFYYVNARAHNYYLLFYLSCELINEIFFLVDFKRYFILVLGCYSLATFTMIYHLWPVFRKLQFKFDGNLLLGPVLGILGTFYVFWELTLLVFEEVPNNSVFFLGYAALICWILFCTLVPVKNRHPHNVLFYGMGASMAIMAPTMFIYTFLWSQALILVLSMSSMMLLKVFLVAYLIEKQKILETSDQYF